MSRKKESWVKNLDHDNYEDDIYLIITPVRYFALIVFFSEKVLKGRV